MSAPSSDKYDLLDRLAEEFAGRYRRGERPGLQEYVDRHPELADEIRKLFPALAQVERAEGDRRAWGEPAEGAAAPLPGQVGDYRIVREVGRGGMGVVYEAEQVSLGRRVALKVLARQVLQDGVALERFRREARAAAKLHHTNIVPVFEVGQEGEVSYYAMQFIPGQGLDQVIKGLARLRAPHPVGAPAPEPAEPAAEGTGPQATPSRDRAVTQLTRSLLSGRFEVPPVDSTSPPPGVSTPPTSISVSAHSVAADAAAPSAVFPGVSKLSTAETGRRHPYYRSVARIGQQAAAALAHAHARGVVHRDIKPSNLLLDVAGVVWITDFGLAKGEDEGLTQTGDILGTLRYMAPERFRGEGDTRADVYALGLTLYELLTLEPAFDTLDRLRLIEQVKSEEPIRPRLRDRRIPRDLETIVLKSADKDPNRRYRTADEMAEDLRRFQAGETILARPVGALERGWRWCRRNPVLAGSLGTVATALVAVALISTVFAAKQAEVRRRVDLSLTVSEFERGQALCEKGEIGPGMLRLISSWRSAVRAGDAAWQHAARTNLAAWQSQCPALMGIFPHSKALSVWGAVSFSPDGKTALTTSLDQTARLWDLATGMPIGRPLTHQGPVLCAAFSPDGKAAITGSTDEDTTARLWDLTTGQPIGSPVAHRGAVWAVAFSPDGKAALTAGFDWTARLWDVATGVPSRVFQHRDSVRSVAFSPDGKTVLTGSWDTTAQLWDAATGKEIGPPLPHLDGVDAVAFSPDGKTVLTGSLDKTARLWDAATGQPIGAPLQHQGPIRCVAFSPDGKTALTGSRDRSARLWDAATGKEIGPPLPHLDGVDAVAFSPDGKTVLTGSWDKTARLWDAATGQPIGAPLQHQGPIRCVAFSPDGKTALTGSDDRSARLWDISTRSRGLSLRHDAAVGSVAFSADGKTVLSTSWDRTIRVWVWDTTGRRKGSPVQLEGRVAAMTSSRALSPDGKTVLTGSRNGTAQFWDAATGKPIGPPLPHQLRIMGVAFSPDGTIALTASGDEARLWDVATGTTRGEPLKHPEQVQSVALSADGKTVLTGCWDGMARLWDAATGQPIGPPLPHQGLVHAVAFSPDGTTALTGSADNTARLWDVASGMPRGALMLHRGQVLAVAFSPDGTTALTGSGDYTARLWDVATEMPRGAPLPHHGMVTAVAFSPDGKTALTGSDDGTARLWPTADLPDDLPRVATWVEALTGLALDPSGSIQPLDRGAWLERREAVRRQGGQPVREAGPSLAPAPPDRQHSRAPEAAIRAR